MDPLQKTSEYFESKLFSIAAKEKTSKKKIKKELEKATNDYSRHKSTFDDLQARKEELERKLEVANTECSSSRKKMLGLHKTIQHMDVSNASDAVFYNDDFGDVGYVIGNKEYHLSINDDGEMSIVPMLAHRRSRKVKPLNEEMPVEDQEESLNNEEPSESGDLEEEEEDCEDVGFINELSELYSDLTNK